MTRKSSPLVPQRHFVAFYISHPVVLALLTWLIVILIASIMGQEILAIIEHPEGNELVHEVFKQEQTISVMLVGLGVLLEGRQLLLSWIHDDSSIQQHQAKNLACEYYGFLIISVGLLIEIIDQLLSFSISDKELLLHLEILCSIPLNLYALYLLVSIGIKLILPSKPD